MTRCGWPSGATSRFIEKPERKFIEDGYNTVVNYINFENATPVIFNALNVIRSIGSFVIIIVLIPVFLFFLLKEKDTVFNGIVSVLPKKYQLHARELGTRANYVIQKYFSGRFLSMFIMSILLTIMFLGFGFNFGRSIFFGFILGFLDIIPYIGGFIGLLLPVLYSFTIAESLPLGSWQGLLTTLKIPCADIEGFEE